jgi:SAM-dependent methyltransferase
VRSYPGCGSGPLTKLGKKHSSKQLMITATDLLAYEYDRLLAELEIKPLVRTIYADAERLMEQFGQNAYDIVHGQNCIDHMADPLHAIEQMLAVSKPKGFVVLYHPENEGQREQYRQLHQWDFTCENGFFVIRDRYGRKTNVTKRLAAAKLSACGMATRYSAAFARKRIEAARGLAGV